MRFLAINRTPSGTHPQGKKGLFRLGIDILAIYML